MTKGIISTAIESYINAISRKSSVHTNTIDGCNNSISSIKPSVKCVCTS